MAAALLCYTKHGDIDPVGLSRCISELAARPVLVVNLELLKHRLSGNEENLPDAKAAEHAKILEACAREAFPDQKELLDKWRWQESGQLCTVSSSSWRVNEEPSRPMPARMSGDYWVKAAIFTTAHRAWNNQDLWSRVSSLPENAIECFPLGNVIRTYNFGHELGHVLQRCPWSIIPPANGQAWQWETEIDADKSVFAGLSILATKELKDKQNEIKETINAVKHGRALSAFRFAPNHYWSALRHDGNDSVTHEQALLANDELRLRVYAEVKDISLPESSREIQDLLRRWRAKEDPKSTQMVILEDAFGDKWNWGKHHDIDTSIPILNSFLRAGDITDPLTRRNAELVIEAALYFRPSLKEALTFKSLPAIFGLPNFQRSSVMTPAHV